MTNAYFIHLLILICIYLILAISLQLSLGYGGLLNLGHIAFFGIGAYVSAILSLNLFPFEGCILSAGIASAIFGLFLSLPTNKLRGDYLALTTLGFSFFIFAIFINFKKLTHGSLGLPGIPRPEILNISFLDNNLFLVLSLAFLIVSYLAIYKIASSPFGKVLEAIRDNELAARSLGKNTLKVKAISLAFSAFFAGIAGSLFAYYIGFIEPFSFVFAEIIPILTIVMIGGLTSFPGAIFATIIITLLPEPIRFINFPPSVIGPVRQILIVAFLFIILFLKPKGFFGKIELE